MAARSPDVVIIGAGIIGSSIAYVLSHSTNLHITVIERGTAGCEASNAAAGVLAVGSVQARRGVLLDLRRRSAHMFPDLVNVLEDETGHDLGYERAGILSLAFTESEAAELQDLVVHRTGQGFRCEWLDGAAVRALEPAVSARVQAGALFADDCTIDSEQFVHATVAAARRRGVEFRMHTSVRSVVSVNGTVRVALQSETLHPGVAVVAGGAWSAELLASSGVKVPLRPARGEMLAVQPVGWRLRYTLATGDGYLVPRRGGEVLIGSTTAFVGFDKRVTTEGIATLRARAAEIVPAARAAPVKRTWAGLRPCSTIRRPIIAPLPSMENVILATGHHRSGILLAPLTAQLTAELVTGAAPSVPMRPLSYRRH